MRVIGGIVAFLGFALAILGVIVSQLFRENGQPDAAMVVLVTCLLVTAAALHLVFTIFRRRH